MKDTSEVTQLDKFKAAARDLECDDDDKRFDAKLKKIAEAGGKKADETTVSDNDE